jgi:DNA-binding XRE family transcriptional regulator
MFQMPARERVKAARVLAGFTSEQLAARLGVSRVNLVYWEKTHDLPARQVAPLSGATGMPERWLKGDDLEGLVTSRPVLPGARVARHFQDRIKVQLLDMGPRMCPGAERITVSSPVGSAYVFFKEGRYRYCLVIFVREPLAGQLQELGGRKIEIDATAWWNAYLQPNYQYLRTILETAGCREWAAVVPEGTPDEQPTTVAAKMEIVVPEAESAVVAINEIKGLVKTLRERGFAVAVSIDESSGSLSVLDGAPAGYVFRPLKRKEQQR